MRRAKPRTSRESGGYALAMCLMARFAEIYNDVVLDKIGGACVSLWIGSSFVHRCGCGLHRQRHGGTATSGGT